MGYLETKTRAGSASGKADGTLADYVRLYGTGSTEAERNARGAIAYFAKPGDRKRTAVNNAGAKRVTDTIRAFSYLPADDRAFLALRAAYEEIRDATIAILRGFDAIEAAEAQAASGKRRDSFVAETEGNASVALRKSGK